MCRHGSYRWGGIIPDQLSIPAFANIQTLDITTNNNTNNNEGEEQNCHLLQEVTTANVRNTNTHISNYNTVRDSSASISSELFRNTPFHAFNTNDSCIL